MAWSKQYFWPVFFIIVSIIAISKLAAHIERSNAEYAERRQRMSDQQALYEKLDIPRDQYGLRYIIGNINGYQVNLPRRAILGWVTYDGDPSDWDAKAKRAYKRPLNSYESKIAQFLFKFRITDGVLLEEGTPIEQEYQKDQDLKRQQWVSVLANSGERYPRLGTQSERLNASFESYTRPVSGATFAYTRHEFGLDVYSFHGGAKPPPDNSYDKQDIFIRRNESNEMTTVIQCSNNPRFAVNSCQHQFFLPDDKVKVFLDVGYARQFLPQWQQIEARTTEIMNGFIVPKSTEDTAKITNQ